MESVINTAPSKRLRGFADECHKTFEEQIIALSVWTVGEVAPRALPLVLQGIIALREMVQEIQM